MGYFEDFSISNLFTRPSASRFFRRSISAAEKFFGLPRARRPNAWAALFILLGRFRASLPGSSRCKRRRTSVRPLGSSPHTTASQPNGSGMLSTSWRALPVLLLPPHREIYPRCATRECRALGLWSCRYSSFSCPYNHITAYECQEIKYTVLVW